MEVAPLKDPTGMEILLATIVDFIHINDMEKRLRAVDLVLVCDTRTEIWECLANIKKNLPPHLWDFVKIRDKTILVNHRVRIIFTSRQEQNETRSYRLES